jgi:hypothetical protein
VRIGRFTRPTDPESRLIGQPGVERLVVGVAGHQPRSELLPAPLVEAFGSPGLDPADVVEGIVLAAPAAERLRWTGGGCCQGLVGQGDQLDGSTTSSAWSSRVSLASRGVDDLVALCFGLG